MNRVTAIIIAVVVCIIVSLGWAVNHYRDNAIAYKDQRDKATEKLSLATRQIFDSGDVSVPIKSWQLYVKTVDIDADSASVTLSVTNPLNNNIGKLYDPSEYTGLQYL